MVLTRVFSPTLPTVLSSMRSQSPPFFSGAGPLFGGSGHSFTLIKIVIAYLKNLYFYIHFFDFFFRSVIGLSMLK